MTPNRRAFAKVVPEASVAVSQLITAFACAACSLSRTEFIQSTARPS